MQGRQGIAIQETYDLTGDNFYNPYWGYQTQSDGTKKKRNARNRDNHKPYLTLGHYWKISEKLNLQTNLYAISGKTSNTNLNWFDANHPKRVLTLTCIPLHFAEVSTPEKLSYRCVWGLKRCIWT